MPNQHADGLGVGLPSPLLPESPNCQSKNLSHPDCFPVASDMLLTVFFLLRRHASVSLALLLRNEALAASEPWTRRTRIRTWSGTSTRWAGPTPRAPVTFQPNTPVLMMRSLFSRYFILSLPHTLSFCRSPLSQRQPTGCGARHPAGGRGWPGVPRETLLLGPKE